MLEKRAESTGKEKNGQVSEGRVIVKNGNSLIFFNQATITDQVLGERQQTEVEGSR